MPELELKRTPGDRRLYALEDVGTLRLEGITSRKATAEAGADRWRFARRCACHSSPERSKRR